MAGINEIGKLPSGMVVVLIDSAGDICNWYLTTPMPYVVTRLMPTPWFPALAGDLIDLRPMLVGTMSIKHFPIADVLKDVQDMYNKGAL